MKMVSIFCDNTYHYIAFNYLLKKKFFVTLTDRIHSEIDFKASECILFFLSEKNLFECIDLYYRALAYKDNLNLMVVGSEDLVNLFNAISGRRFSSIDIYLSIDEIIVYLRNFVNHTQSLEKVVSKVEMSTSELEIMRMLSMGFSVTEIASMKGKSVKTISSHKCSFFRKFGLKNNQVNLVKLTHIGKYYFCN